MKITFGICTFNRKDVLEKSAASLRNITGYDRISVRIYDDASTEYDDIYLKNLFPGATVHRNSENVGADRNTYFMYEDFLKSGDEWFFNADSDLLYHTNIIQTINGLIDNGKEMVSLFNALSHKTTGYCNDEFVYKDDVGAAGCLFSRRMIGLIVGERIMEHGSSIDYGFSNMLRSKGYDILVLKESAVQHIGVSGYNAGGILFDYGEGFKCDSLVNAQALEDTFELYMKQVERFKKSMVWRLYYKCLIWKNKMNKKLSREKLQGKSVYKI